MPAKPLPPVGRTAWVALATIMHREIVRLCRIWTQTILPPIISTLLYFLIFGALIGQRIGEIQGHRFIEYITPGIAMMAIINNSYANVSSSFFSAKFQRYIEEMLVAPIPCLVILCGYTCGGIFRGLLVGLIVIAVSLFFQDLHIHNAWLMLVTAAMASALFALGGLINGILANKFDDISLIPTFILTPLTYLGGVFYSISLLPEFWELVSRLNPILYMVNSFRYGFLGVSDVNVAVALAITAGCTLGLGFTAWLLLVRGIGLKP
ncbi:MAG: ABC transporter permease [Gammaproteobacteria bacterium]|nr:ABC transporter permease [Gammaproteobacteria bacterium]MDD9824432.1 ABC transporter permease [Gammaproteobacteria bacterium]